MSEFNLDKAISDAVENQEFFDDYRTSIKSILDPEKRVKAMASLMDYKISKLKTVEAVSEDRYRPISITYHVVGKEPLSVDNSSSADK